MFFLFSFLALFLYTGNSLSFTFLARKLKNVWALTAWRGIILGTMTAVWLIFSTPGTWIFGWQKILFAAIIMGLTGNIATIANFESVKILPVGICTGLSRLSVIPTFILGYFFAGENLFTSQYIGCAVIVLAGMLMAPKITRVKTTESDMTITGIFWIILRIAVHGIWYFFLGYLTRGTDPWFATFVGEFAQAPVMFGLIMVMTKKRKEFFAFTPHAKDIFLFCFFAFFATPAFAYAMKIGNIGVAAVIISLIGVTTSLYGRFFWREKLLLRQWFGVAISIIGICMLNIHKFF